MKIFTKVLTYTDKNSIYTYINICIYMIYLDVK